MQGLGIRMGGRTLGTRGPIVPACRNRTRGRGAGFGVCAQAQSFWRRANLVGDAAGASFCRCRHSNSAAADHQAPARMARSLFRFDCQARRSICREAGSPNAGRSATGNGSRPGRMKWKDYVWPAIGLAAVVLSAWLLYGELRGISLDDVGEGLSAISLHQWLFAGAQLARRLCRARRLRPHRAPAHRQAGFLALHHALLVHHLCAVAQYRRLGAVGRGDPLPRLRLARAVGVGGRHPGGGLLVHLRAGHGDAFRAGPGAAAVDRQPLLRRRAARRRLRARRGAARAGRRSTCSAACFT